jgi:hypothetical protein
MRADIPYGLDLLPSFWKNLIGCDLDPVTDLQDADITTYYYIKKIEMVYISKLHTRDLYSDFVFLGGERS